MLLIKRKIRLLFLSVMLHCSFYTTMSQINYTANDAGQVPAYNSPFLYGNNMGYYGSTWDNITLSNIAAGNPLFNVAGVGSKSFRIPAALVGISLSLGTIPKPALESLCYRTAEQALGWTTSESIC